MRAARSHHHIVVAFVGLCLLVGERSVAVATGHPGGGQFGRRGVRRKGINEPCPLESRVFRCVRVPRPRRLGVGNRRRSVDVAGQEDGVGTGLGLQDLQERRELNAAYAGVLRLGTGVQMNGEYGQLPDRCLQVNDQRALAAQPLVHLRARPQRVRNESAAGDGKAGEDQQSAGRVGRDQSQDATGSHRIGGARIRWTQFAQQAMPAPHVEQFLQDYDVGVERRQRFRQSAQPASLLLRRYRDRERPRIEGDGPERKDLGHKPRTNTVQPLRSSVPASRRPPPIRCGGRRVETTSSSRDSVGRCGPG